MRDSHRAGFTLIEAIVALLLGGMVVALVSVTFLVQNRFYSAQQERAVTRDVVTAGTELVAAELRSVMRSGVTVAGPRTLTVRSPLMVFVACDHGGSHLTVFVDGGFSSLDTAEVAGVAARDSLTGDWTYGNGTWSNLYRGGGNPDEDCEDHGADTLWASTDFHRLDRDEIDVVLGFEPVMGDVVMLFRETTFTFESSSMDPTTMGLFRAAYGGSATEFATGFDTTAAFRYRTGGSTYSDTVAVGDLDDIDVVGIVAEARRRVAAGGVGDVTFGWSVNIALRNSREE